MAKFIEYMPGVQEVKGSIPVCLLFHAQVMLISSLFTFHYQA